MIVPVYVQDYNVVVYKFVMVCVIQIVNVQVCIFDVIEFVYIHKLLMY